jgi:hypothetical protein
MPRLRCERGTFLPVVGELRKEGKLLAERACALLKLNKLRPEARYPALGALERPVQARTLCSSCIPEAA